MVKQIFFDLGLTLVHNDMPRRYQTAFKEIGYDISLSQAERAYHLANKYFMRFRQGALSQKSDSVVSDFHRCVCQYLDTESAWKDFSNQLKKMERPVWRCFDFTLNMLDELNDMGIKTGLISNWDLSCREVLEKNKILSRLNCVVVSEEVGAEKPDKKIFEEALKLTGANPDECFYVGDNYYDDYIGSQKVSMPCAIINYQGKLGIEEVDCPIVIEQACEVVDLMKKHLISK